MVIALNLDQCQNNFPFQGSFDIFQVLGVVFFEYDMPNL